MFTGIATSWISTHKDALYSAQEIEALLEEWLLTDLMTKRSLALDIYKSRTSPFPVLVSETSSMQTWLPDGPLF